MFLYFYRILLNFAKNRNRFVSIFLCSLFLMQQTLLLPVLASDISGVTPSGNVYNITPSTIKGSTGFKHYNNFNLSQGDIANLIFNGGYSKFVNLVNNQININGIVNSVNGSGAFHSGHVIFISPNGMVVGSSGVLNVGALSVFTPKQSVYDSFSADPGSDFSALKTSSQGVITINGKIFARDGVDIYGKTITVGNDATVNTSTGVFSGLDPNTYNSTINSNQAATDLFNALVNTKGVNKGTSFINENGKIVIKAQSATTDGTASNSSVTVKNAYLDGKGIDISATSTAEYSPAVSGLSRVIDTLTDTDLDNIVDGTYSIYDSAVSSAVVEISNGAKLVSDGDVNLSSSASSKTEASSTSLLPTDILYLLGTKTTSKVNVKSGTNIDTTGDLKLSAGSSNQLDVNLKSRNDFLSSIAGTDSSLRFIVISAKNEATTEATLDSGSAVKADNVTVNAINATSNAVYGTTKATFCTDDSSPVVGGSVVINTSNISTIAKIDTNIDTSNAGDININAQTLNNSSIGAYSEASGNDTSSGQTQTEADKNAKQGTITKIKALYTKYTAKEKSSAETSFSGSGSVTVNNSTLNTSATIGKNATINADNVTVNASTVDLTANQATASSSNANVSAGAALVLNFQKDTTTAQIEDGTATNHATVNVNNNLTINATNQMPWNLSTLEFLYGVYDTAKSPFSSEFWADFLNSAKTFGANAKELVITFRENGYTDTFGIPGFFNNYAQSTGQGETVGIAGSVIYSGVENSTLARIGDYTRVNQGSNSSNIVINASNNVIYNNMAGVLEALYKFTSGTSGTVGVGGSLLITDNTHNAKSQVGNNVTVNTSGDMDLKAATSQTMINVAAGGAGAKALAVTGSVAVILNDGTTETSVGNSDITAKSLELNSGTSAIKTATRTGFSIDGVDDTTGLLKLTDTASNINDETSLVTITGALAKQTGDGAGGSSSSSGVAVGASIAVVDVDKDVNSLINDGASITLNNGLDVAANTNTQSINVAAAGAFAGGVSVDKTKQTGANVANTDSDPATTGDNQTMSNQGSQGGLNGWIDKVDGILAKLTGKTAGTDTTTTNATSTDIKNNNENSGTGNTDTLENNLANKSGSIADTANSNTAKSNLSVAAAGSVNAQINRNTVTASVGNANITVNSGNVNVASSQTSSNINVAAGIANSKTVGAGAAINLLLNSGTTTAISNAHMSLTDASDSNVNITANDTQRGINVAVGVAAAKGDPNNTSSTTAAIGGSFNVAVIENTANATLGSNSNINHAKDINVKANNRTELYNVAGSGAYSSSSGTSIGAGIAANVNVIDKTTHSLINTGAVIQNSDGTVKVASNELSSSDNPSERLVSAAVGGAIVTGGSSGYTFAGALGVDVLNNDTSALIDGANISSSAVSVIANDYIWNLNIDGALTFSSTSSGVGVGIGTVVEVVTNNVTAKIKDSTINASNGNVGVSANQTEELRFLAMNVGVSTGSSGIVATVNGIVNVLISSINSEITNSTITSSSDTSVSSIYDTTIQGITGVGGIATGASNSLGGNIIVNVINNDVYSKLTSSDVTSQGTVGVTASSSENINIIPVAVAISASGSLAAAGNIAANVILNDTRATISGKKTTNGKVYGKNGVNVTATDNTSAITRGGTVAISGGTAAVGGSILLDILVKNTEASIADNTIVNSDGAVSVSATSENLSGPKTTIDFADYDSTTITSVASLADWQMVYDLAGGNTAAVSGSLVTKVVNNTVKANVGKNANITAGSLDVEAVDNTYVRAIVGNLTASGTAAIGGSMFLNVVKGTTEAKINEGATVSTTGDVDVSASAVEDVKTIMIVGGAGGTAAVNGSLNVNTIIDTTTATIYKANINSSAGGVSVLADQTVDISSFNLAVSASGTASVGAVGYVNVFSNNLTSSILDSTVNAVNDVTVNADDKDSFGAIMIVIAGSGTASVAALGVANVIDSNINSYIEGSSVTSSSGQIDVEAAYDSNKDKYGDKSVNLIPYMNSIISGSETLSIDDIKALLPIVSVLNVAGSGTAAIGGTVVVNTIANTVDAHISRSLTSTTSSISSANGLTIKATSNITTYDALTSFAASGYASVNGTVLTNVITGTTKAYLDKTIVSRGNVNVEATQYLNLNAVLLGAVGSGIGAAVAAVLDTNTFANSVTAKITDSTLSNGNNVTVSATSNNEVNVIAVQGALNGVGAAVTGVGITNVAVGNTEAGISGSTISDKNVSVTSSGSTTLFDLISVATISGVGADVGVNVATNVVSDNVSAYIKDDSTLSNNTSTTISATTNYDIYDIVASVGFNGVGATVAGTIVSNIVDNDVNAYLEDTDVTNGTVAVSASQTTNLHGGVSSLSIGGLSVAASVHAVTNIFLDRVNAYIKNSDLTNTTSISVSGSSSETINFATLSGSGAGLAGIAGSVLTNVIDNDLASYITGGSISGGTISVTANQTTDLDNLSGGVQFGGAAVGARSIINVLTNTATAYIDDTSITNSTGITVSSTSTENIVNNNYSASGALGTAGGLGILVNVIENTTRAYLNAKAKTVTSSGTVAVSANDTLTLNNTAGIAAVSAGYSAAASINVNVINNAVIADLLSTTGSINANAVNVASTSSIDLDVITASLAGGMLGLAGAISVNSIGDKFASDSDNSSYVTGSSSNTVTSDAETSANTTSDYSSSLQVTDGNGDSYDYTSKVGNVDLDAGTTSAKEGTVANINGKVNAADAVDVTATNTFTGNVINAAASGGLAAAGASVLITDMKYSTAAKISGGTVKSTSGKNINVTGTNSVTATTNAASGAAGAIALGGNIAIFKNKAVTSALIKDATVTTAGDVTVNANSIDNISTRAVSGTAGLATASAVVALSQTDNTTSANIDNSTVSGDDVKIKANNTSSLTSEMESGSVSGYSFSALVNLARSNAVTSAIVSNSSSITANNFDLVSSTGGITSNIIMYVGSLTFIGGSVTVSASDINSTFNSTVDGTITANNVKLKAGVNKDDESIAGTISSTITSKKLDVSVISVSEAYQNSSAGANTNISTADGSTITASDIDILSSLNRNASTGQSSASLGAINIGAIQLNSTVDGNSGITINGSLIADTINLAVNDTNTATARMISASLTLVGGSSVTANATVNNTTNISSGTTGSLNANSITVSSNSTRTASVANASYSASLASLGYTSMSANARGTSNIDLKGKVRAKNTTGAANLLDVDITDTSNAYDDSVSYSLAFASGNGLSITSFVDSGSNLTIGGNVKATTIDVDSTTNRTSTANSVSSSAGLASIGGFYLISRVDGDSTVNFNGTITDNTAMSIDSIVNNTVKTYTSSFSAGLLALASGSTYNHIDNTTNYIKFLNGSNITTNGTISANSQTNNKAYMTASSGTYGFVAVKGGTLTNTLNSTSGTMFTDAIVNATDINVTSANNTTSPNAVKFDDSSGGFVTSSGATINTTINQTNNVNSSGNSKVYGQNTLTIDLDNSTDFSQEVNSDASGFSVYNKASSNLNVTNNNNVNITGNAGSYIKGRTVLVTEDVHNTLSSKADVEAHHFAGQPSTYSTANAANNNNVNVSGNFLADELMNIQFMGSASSAITQYAHVYVEAAVASADWGGGINYSNYNRVNVQTGGKIASGKDVLINYKNGSESLNSTVSYRKVSRLLFGIPITKSGSSSRISTSRSNILTLDGTIEAGSNSHKVLTIDKDGNATSDSTITDSLYDKSETTSAEDASAAEIAGEISDLQALIDALNNQKTALQADNTKNIDKIAEIDAQISDLNTDIANLTTQITKINYTAGLYTADNNSVSLLTTIKSDLGTILTSTMGAAYTGLSAAQQNYIIDQLSVASSSSADMTNAINNLATTYSLSADAKTALTNSLNGFQSKFGAATVSGQTYQTYAVTSTTTTTVGGVTTTTTTTTNRIIHDNITSVSSLESEKTSVNTALTDLNTDKSYWTTAKNTIDSQISALDGKISDYNAQIADINTNGIHYGLSSNNGSYSFEDLYADGGSITIKGLNTLNGSGNFVISLADILINNYSNYNLIFKNIAIGNDNTGLNINNHSYTKAGKIGSTDVSLVIQTGGENAGQITINNWFDASNPTLPEGTMPSSMLFKGTITNKISGINIFNDGGNIIFKDTLTGSALDIVASQGNVSYNSAATNFDLNSDSRIIAGSNIYIKADDINLNGEVKAGIPTKSITITNDMLTSLIVDPLTGDTNMIDLGGTEKSDYLNDLTTTGIKGNIKALYKDGKILLFDTATTGGSVTLNGTVTGDGTVQYTSGYGSITIDNQTDKPLLVNGITNNNINGTLTGAGSIDSSKINKLGTDSATTNITSIGTIEVNGLVSTGNDGSTNNGSGSLSITSNTGIDIKNKLSSGSQTETIDATGSVDITNTGTNGITVSGKVKNRKGNTVITNNNISATSGITVASTGRIINTGGSISSSNNGTIGTVIQGIINGTDGDISINNTNSNIVVGDNTDNDCYIEANTGNINITNTHGSLLNSGVNKTLAKTDKNLTIQVTDGNIGSSSAANPGIGVEKGTRKATESFNINVGGTVTASALMDSTTTPNLLVNLRSKNSDMNINRIKADGNVILTATDWKQPDQNPTPNNEDYFRGYSILNASINSDLANIEGYNISLVSSNNIGTSSNWLTYNQYNDTTGLYTGGNWLSAEAENDLYLKTINNNVDTNIWQLITKRGSMGLQLSGNNVIREITAGKDLTLINTGANLTIYDLGRLPHMLNPDDDILYPHDRIALASVAPESVNIQVLDIDSRTRVNPNQANSILNIYNAFIKGKNQTQSGVMSRVPDVTLRADNIIAHAYGAPSSPVETLKNPDGFNAKDGRTYADNPLDPTAIQNLHATGFNSFDSGRSLVFDIKGVNPALVSAIGRNINERNYYEQPFITTIQAFTNPYSLPGNDYYKVKNLSLSVNSNSLTTENRGSIFNYLYVDDAYIDTRDLHLSFLDSIINHYAEFRNGNRGGQGDYPGHYRWMTIVDNDYRRIVSNYFNVPLTLQLYTELTGSFHLDMGNLIVLRTSAPTVYYDSYQVRNLPHTENSFTRLLPKIDIIQKDTTTSRFKEIDKRTYMPTKRLSLRFAVNNLNNKSNLSSNGAVKAILDISKGGLFVEHDGSLKVGDKFNISLTYKDLEINQEVLVVRLNGNRAGLKFVNMDKVTANKILYLTMLASQNKI